MIVVGRGGGESEKNLSFPHLAPIEIPFVYLMHSVLLFLSCARDLGSRYSGSMVSSFLFVFVSYTTLFGIKYAFEMHHREEFD